MKHDDLREASVAFMQELGMGKEFVADQKAAQIDTLQANTAAMREELTVILASLGQGEHPSDGGNCFGDVVCDIR